MNLLFQAAQQARQIRERQELIFWTTCGPTTTFDPKITGVDGVWFFDDGTTLAASSGSEISKTFAADGLHRAVYRPGTGGLAAITAIEAASDAIVRITGTRFLSSRLKTVVVGSNAGLVASVSDFPNSITYLGADFMTSVDVDLAYLPLATHLYVAGSNCRGALNQLPITLQIAWLHGCTGVTVASIAHLVVVRDIRVSNANRSTADVDTVIDSMWSARANYTYATPALQIGGTNQPPTGTVGAPMEGADWHQDGATWIPLTTGAKAYDLAKDVNSEGFKKWTITYTGGSIAP